MRMGRRGEELAASFLRRAGYRILKRNYRYQRCEIDIIARQGDTLVFVEVKTRTSLRFGPPILSITPAKTRHICKAAHAYAEYEHPGCANIRFDVVSVFIAEGTVTIEHTRDAFRYGS